MTAAVRFFLRYRWLILLAMAVITAASGAMLSQAVFASSMTRMFLGEHPGYPKYVKRVAEFGSDEIVVIGVADAALLSPASQKQLKRAVKKIAALEPVLQVRSLLDAQQIKGEEDRLDISPYARQALRHPEQSAQILRDLQQDPLVGGLLVADDGKHHCVVVELQADIDRHAEDIPALIEELNRIFVDAGYAADALHIVGLPVSVASIIDQTHFNFGRLTPIVLLVLLIAVWVMFRRLWPVAISALVALVSVAWTMGFAVLLDRQISVMTAMVPAVILIISFSDVIHLCSAYLLELGRGVSKEEAILKSGADVGRACFFTSITTCLGFMSLSLVPTPIFRVLGLVLGFGAASALLIALTLTPILFRLLPAPKPWQAGLSGRVQGGLTAFLSRSVRLTNRRPKAVVLVFLLLGAASVWGLTRLTIETDFVRRMPVDHPLRTGQKFMQEHFAGSTTIDVYIDAPAPDGLLEPKLFAAVAAFSDAIVELDEVARVTSLVDLMRSIHREIQAGTEPGRVLPDSRAALAQYLLLFEMSGGSDLDRLVDFNRQSMRLTLHLPQDAFRRTRAVGARVEAMAAQHLAGQAEVEATGLIYLTGQFLDEIIAGQRRGLVFALLAIAIMMVIGLGSLRVGLWSMIANVLPLLVLGGYLGLCWDEVDSDVIAIGMIAIGIGVDDTIHFLMRFKIESERGQSVEQALEQTFHFAGRGIVITSVILVLGFAPFALADYLSTRIMGTLLPLTLMVALAADLYLVPAMIKLGAMRFRPPRSA